MNRSGGMPHRPGGQLASRPLHVVWLVDGSGSMGTRGKIQALNQAIRDAIPPMQAVALENPHAAIYVNAIRFGDDARWLAERLIPISEFHWEDVKAGGVTALGEALTMIGDALQPPLIRGRALPPLLALVTDGLPTDDFQTGLAHLLSKPWGKQSVRVAIALGGDAAGPEPQEVLRAFISGDEPRALQANNPVTLARQIRWIATAALNSVCSPEHLPASWNEGKPTEPALPNSGAGEDAW